MVDYSLSNDRLIGMIQQQENKDLYKIGCFGKITAFNETPDKRYLISLEGISCFKISKEIKTKHKFRIFKVENIKNYNQNYLEEDLKKEILERFKKYNEFKKLNVNINDLSELKIFDLLKFIVMISPFDFGTKQMFLELSSSKELYENLLSTLEIELASKQSITTLN